MDLVEISGKNKQKQSMRRASEMRLFSFAQILKVENTNKIQKEENNMQKNKFVSKVSAGILSALIAVQGMIPTVAVMADEISDTDETSIAIEEPMEDAESFVAEETETSDTSATEPIESDETAVPTKYSEEPEPAETSETSNECSDVNIEDAADMEDFSDIVSALPSSNRLIVQSEADIRSDIENATGAYFDGTYVISFADDTAYESAISAFETDGITYAEDGSVMICSDEFGFINYEGINPNAQTKIAVIDTGSDIANEQYSVIGDSVSDDHGHGTAIANYVLSETDDAYIISIKAIGADGIGNVSDICAAITMAQNMDVDIVLMALSVKDSGDYDAFKQLITDTVSSGITVIASAGNNNTDASMYLPAGIDGVITIGAITEDGYKYSSSNYGDCVNYYVPATSTSEASAVFAGKYIAGNISEVATSCVIGEDEPTDPIETDTNLAEVNFTRTQAGVYLFVTADQMLEAGYTNSDDFRDAIIESCDDMTGAEYAQSGGNGVSGEKVDCITYTHIAYAQSLGLISDVRESGGKVYFSGSCAGGNDWKLYTTTGATGCTSWLALNGIGSPSSAGVNPDNYSLNDLGVEQGDLVFFGKTSDGFWHHAAIYDGSGTAFWQARGTAYTAGKSNRSDVTVDGEGSGYNRILVLHIEDFVEDTEITIVKSAADDYSVLTDGNACYNLDGTTYTLYGSYSATDGVSDALTTFTVNANGVTDTTYKIQTNSTYYLKETKAGVGFDLDTHIYKIETGSRATSDITVTDLMTNFSSTISADDDLFTIPMTDIPVSDPFAINLDKISTEGQHTTADFNNAKFRLEFYGQDIAFDTSVIGLAPIAVFEFNLDGTSQRVNLEFLAGLTATMGSDMTYFKELYESDILDGGKKLPLGTYRVYEIDAPDGYSLNTQAFRVRIYQDANGKSARQYGIEGVGPNGYNYFSHTLDQTDPNYDLLRITLNETTVNGYYSLTKKMDDTVIVKNIAGLYNFELRDTTDNTLIATGVSMSDGRVLWTYKLANLYSADNPGILLTGTTTYELELAVYNADNAKITYEVREYLPDTTYGDTAIEYSYTVPSDWTVSADGTYFSKNFTLNENNIFADSVKNNVEYGDISISKAIPDGDTFDRTKVTFYLYNTDSNVLIATGKVDSNGNIEWTKAAEAGYGVDDCRVGINAIEHLPLGNYRIEEVWDRYYLESLDGEMLEIISTNNSEWILDQKTYSTRYYKDFALNEDGKTFSFGSVINDEHVQWFNMTKTVVADGDISTLNADLFYVTDSGEYVLIATGTCETSNGQGIYNFTWDFNGESEMQNGIQTLKLPEGNYVVREYVPITCYANDKDNVPYTYMVPEGFTEVSDADGKPCYYEKTFRADNNSITVNSQNIVNTRIEASLEIRKVEQAATIDRDFTFAIYYRGNESEAQNIGVFTDEYLLDTITVHTSQGSGMATLDKIPEGWYEIIEINASEWAAEWVNTDSNTADGKLVHATSENGTNANPVIRDNVALFGVDIPGVLIYNRISIDVLVRKYDSWTNTVIAIAGNHPENIHLTFHLYKDTNGNGVLDNDEPQAYEVRIDVDDDGNVVFENISAGKYILREAATVNGYYLTAPDIAFEVSDAINFEARPANTPYSEPVRVTKVDNETNEPLSGAEFAVYVDSNDNEIWDEEDRIAQVWVDENADNLIDDGELTDCVMTETLTGIYESNGSLHFNDGSEDFGNRYFIVEVNAPIGYFFVNSDGTFTTENTYEAFSVDRADTTAADFEVGTKEFTFRNQTGSVFVHKVNSEGEFLSGAEFAVFADEECTVFVGILTEDSDNERYVFKGLGLGTYYIKELTAPEYYVEDPNVYSFEISTEDVNVIVDNFDWDVIDGMHGDFLNINPIVSTTLTDTVTNTHIVALQETITLVDTVEYRGLTVGKTYVMEGTLYDKLTGEVIKDADGYPITSAVMFVPTTSDGIVEVPFALTMTTVTGKTLVAGEKVKLERSERYCGIHYDLNDEEQTVYVPKIGTTATIDGEKSIYLGSTEVRNITVTDTIAYEGLIPGMTYRAEATLYKADGTQLMVGGNPIISMIEFTPESSEGTVEVSITFSSEGLSDGDKIVVFEKVYDVETGILIGSHEDLNDEGQTVIIHFRPSTGEILPTYAKIGAALLAISTVIASVVIRRKKKLSC